MSDIQWFTDRLAPTLGEEIAEVIPLGPAYGSNQVFRIVTASGRHYVTKFPKPVRDAISPFWRQLAALFGCTIDVQLRSLPKLVEQLNVQQVVPVPQVIHVAVDAADLEERFSLVTYIAGQSYEPDEFPPSAGLHEQLGQFVGALHARTYPGFGNLDTGPARDRAEFLPLATATMKQIINDFWHNHPSLLTWLARATENVDAATIFKNASLIMPDISANQFVYHGDRLAGVVDLDAYVIGPREFELTVLEMGISDPQAFRHGYEQYTALPRFTFFRPFYRLWLYLNDPPENRDPHNLDDFMQRNIHFD